MAALLLTSMVWSGHAQEKNEMDLSGEWAFQTDVMLLPSPAGKHRSAGNYR